MDKKEYKEAKTKIEKILGDYLTNFQPIEKEFSESLIKKFKYFNNVQSVVFENINGKYVDYDIGRQNIEDGGSSASLEYYKSEPIYYEIKHLLEIMDELMRLRKQENNNFVDLKDALVLEIKAMANPDEISKLKQENKHQDDKSKQLDNKDNILYCFVKNINKSYLLVSDIIKMIGLHNTKIENELKKLITEGLVEELEYKIQPSPKGGKKAFAYKLTEKSKNALNNKEE